MHKNSLGTAFKNIIHIIFCNLCLTFHDDLITLDRNNLTGILIYEVLVPALQDTGCKFTTQRFLESGLVNLYFLCQFENLKDILIILVSDSTKQSGNRQLLLTVNVCIHHIINIRSKLNPRTLERNDTGTVQQCSVGMYVLSEEHTRRTVQLRNDNALSTIDNKRTIGGHIGDGTQEYILNHCTEVLMIRICAVKFQLCLQGYTISQSTLQTLINGVTRRINIVIQELKNEIITCIGDREVFSKHLIQTVILAFLRGSIQLQEVFE